jgi:hypothetical protein
VICIDVCHIKAVAYHTFVAADAPANEQSVRAESALPSTPDIHFVGRQVRNVPIVLKKSFLADEPKFSGSLMRSRRGDVRDHIDLHQRNHTNPRIGLKEPRSGRET